MNLPESRLVPISCGPKSLSLPEYSLFSGNWGSGCRTIAPIPTNLHLCTESRKEALKVYKPSLGWARGPGEVFLRPENDILFFGPCDGFKLAESQFHSCMALCDQDEVADLQRIAISDDLFWINGTYTSMMAASITVGIVEQFALRMHGLEEVIFVPREEDLFHDPQATYARMESQIQMAMQCVSAQFKYWCPPDWKILPLRYL